MFGRLFAVAALAAFVVAQECSTGTIQCCNTPMMDASEAHSYLKMLGYNDLENVTGDVAGGCSPASVVGVGNSGANCAQEPICCNDNTFWGLISIGCSPINIDL